MGHVTARMRTLIVPNVRNGFNFPLTSIILIEWTNDRQAIAAGYSGGQVIVWSPEVRLYFQLIAGCFLVKHILAIQIKTKIIFIW